MIPTPARFILAALGLVPVAALVTWYQTSSPPLFDSQKLEFALAMTAPIPVWTIMPQAGTTICVLGPYQDPAFLASKIDTAFLRQLNQSSVPEFATRFAIFGKQSNLLHEDDVPNWQGSVRIETTGADTTFCKDVQDAMVRLIADTDHTSVQFIH